MQTLPAAFDGLRAYPKFFLYMLKPNPKKPGKFTKIPVAPFTRDYDETGINPQVRRWWVDADTAIDCAKKAGENYGVAYFFTESDPFFFLDIDNCKLPSGDWSPLALELLNDLSGAAVEVSQSGDGLHIFGRCEPFDHGCKNGELGIELYTEGRFVALTGNFAGGDIETDRTSQIRAIADRYFQQTKADRSDWTNAPRDDWQGYQSDAELLDAALASKSVASAFGGSATFADLWKADQDRLAEAYPDADAENGYNASQADAALAQHLAFWTGCNCQRIYDLMQTSGLVREKWENHATYLELTITKAVAMQKDVHRLKRLEPEAAQPMPTLSTQPTQPTQPAPSIAPPAPASGGVLQPQLASGFQFLPVEQQLVHFKDCVYVRQDHAVLTPDGESLKPDQFRASYGGYLFALDAIGDKTTKNAWEAFVESQAVRFPKAHRAHFKPDQIYGTVEQREGLTYVNKYVPVYCPTEPGDVTPFLTHVAKVLPDPHDQQIILAYMAAVVQYPGCKFQWAPLLQGAEGNGKTLFSRCVMNAIGKRYTHAPKAMEIDSKFNGWLLDKIFIMIEDIYVPEHKMEVWETLKPMITGGDGIEIQKKGHDQFTADICANFMLNSNHKNAVIKTRNDRRLAVFFTAQQRAEDLQRDGMGGDYFPRLYQWLRAGGYAKVTNFLQTYAIPVELNPAVDAGGLAQRAPVTSTNEQAIEQSIGRVEQEILEAIDEGRPGFCGGWVSSAALDRLLDDIKGSRAVPRNKRRDLMIDLGYDYHPALKTSNGRSTVKTSTDGTRPRLFLKMGHPAQNIVNGSEVAAAYDKAQNKSEAPAAAGPAYQAFNS